MTTLVYVVPHYVFYNCDPGASTALRGTELKAICKFIRVAFDHEGSRRAAHSMRVVVLDHASPATTARYAAFAP